MKIKFDTQAAVAKAWKVLWDANLRERAEGRDFRGCTFHLTASDLERQVRRFAEDTAEGRPWTTERADYYGSTVRFRGDLQGTVRRWLQAERAAGRLTSHNFGRGHISGERYRPAGAPLYGAEAANIRAKAERRANPKPRLRHLSHKHYPLCSQPRSRWGRGRTSAWLTTLLEEVTCPRCRKLAAAPRCEAVENKSSHPLDLVRESD